MVEPLPEPRASRRRPPAPPRARRAGRRAIANRGSSRAGVGAPPPRPGQPLAGPLPCPTGLLAAEDPADRSDPAGDRLAVLRRLQPGADLGGLARPEPGGGDLGRLVLQEVEPPLELGGVDRELLEGRPVGAPAATAAAIAPRSPSSPPNASSRSRCQRSSRRRCCSCWPWISTSGPTVAASRPAVTVSSSRRATERPAAATSRTPMSGSGSRSNSASTRAVSAPWRTSPVSARAPSARPSASMRRLLPAPVSPVMTLRPGREGEPHPLDEGEVADRELEEATCGASGRVSSAAGAVTTAAARPSGGAGPRTASAPSGSMRRIGRS